MSSFKKEKFMSLLTEILSKYPNSHPSWQFQDSIENLEGFAKFTSQDPQTLFWKLVSLSAEDLIRGCTIIVKFEDHLTIVYDGIV
jgi:hypothetical protein